MPALKRPDPAPELDPENEDVKAPNIAAVITVRLGVGTFDSGVKLVPLTRDDLTHRLSNWNWLTGNTLIATGTIFSPPYLHYLHDEGQRYPGRIRGIRPCHYPRFYRGCCSWSSHLPPCFIRRTPLLARISCSAPPSQSPRGCSRCRPCLGYSDRTPWRRIRRGTQLVSSIGM